MVKKSNSRHENVDDKSFYKAPMPLFSEEDKEKMLKRSMQKRHSLSLTWKFHVHDKPSSYYIPKEKMDYVENMAFITKSRYTGHANKIGLQGIGEYTLPHKVKRVGYMVSSMFNGLGTQEYPRGDLIEGSWKNDVLTSYTYHFVDKLQYKAKKWEYCCKNDRRFQRSLIEGMRPSPLELRTNDNVPREIPPGCYDVGEGFYNPKTKCIVSEDDLSKVLRIPSNSEATWIMYNCRKAWDQPIGYRPDLYEIWCTGRKSEKELLMNTKRFSIDTTFTQDSCHTLDTIITNDTTTDASTYTADSSDYTADMSTNTADTSTYTVTDTSDYTVTDTSDYTGSFTIDDSCYTDEVPVRTENYSDYTGNADNTSANRKDEDTVCTEDTSVNTDNCSDYTKDYTRPDYGEPRVSFAGKVKYYDAKSDSIA